MRFSWVPFGKHSDTQKWMPPLVLEMGLFFESLHGGPILKFECLAFRNVNAKTAFNSRWIPSMWLRIMKRPGHPHTLQCGSDPGNRTMANGQSKTKNLRPKILKVSS